MLRSTYFSALAMLTASAVWAQQPPAAKPAVPVLPLEQVVEKLIAETESFKTNGAGFQFKRPHPIVRQLAPDSAPAVAARLPQAFTGEPLRDIYIRYHLMHVILTAEGKPLPGADFQKLHDALPAESGFAGKPAVTWEPPELARQYWKLMEECTVTTGFPPFQKRVGPPDSFQFMDDAKKKASEGKWAEAQELKKKFKSIVDEEAKQWNDRLGWLPWMLRQTRGDAMYCMVRSGEPKMLEAAVGLVGKNLTTNRQQALDYIAFLNAVYFDGWLGQYDKSVLKTSSSTLKRLVVAGDLGQKGEKIRKDSLSELAFTIITAMETGHVPPRPEKGDQERPVPNVKAFPRNAITAASIDLEMIDSAIERALTALDGQRPPDTDLGTFSYAQRYSTAYSRALLLPGNQALATWAMLSAGESPQAPWVQKRIGWTACFESTDTYDRSMRLRALSSLSDRRWQPWIKRDTDWLISSMTDQGNFNHEFIGGPLTGFGDNANGTYAALGLAGARRAGYEVPDDVWKKIDTYWRNAQFPDKSPGAGGWAVRSHKAIKPGDNTNDFANRVSAPMTAGGLLSLSLTERFLLGPKRLEVGNKLTPEFAAGLDWLDSNFNFDAVDGDSDLFYYLWTIQNVGQATGYRTFNKTDWFREATARLLSQQGADGLWKGPKGPTISTSFALLYLYRARGPLAFCKVRFTPEAPATPAAAAALKNRGPVWNNRPNDLVNLTDEISRQVEVPTSWQIADLDQPAYELAESATLYLATDQSFKLTEPQLARLREYIDAGGTLIAAPEGGNVTNAIKSMKSLANELYPARELKKVDPKHLFYTLNEKVTDNTPMSMIDNGIRPLMVIIEKDIGRDLQADAKNRREAFRLMTNIYLYTTGRDTKRARIASNFIQRGAQTPKSIVQAARIKYDGDFNPEPMSLTQLSNLLANKHSIDLQVQTLGAEELKSEQQIAFLTLTEKAKLTPAQLTAIKQWVEAGGTLWIDVAGGTAAAATAVDPLLVGLGYSLSDFKSTADTPVFTGKTAKPGGYEISKPSFRFFTEGELPSLKCATVGERPAVYLTQDDLSAGLAGANHWGIAGYSVTTARQLVLNSVLNLPKPGAARPAAKPATAPAATRPATPAAMP